VTVSKQYQLPALPYGFKDLEPFISEEQLRTHHQQHHRAFVERANELLGWLDRGRREGIGPGPDELLKELAVNVGGHLLHAIFWSILGPADGGENKPQGQIKTTIEREFGNFERLRNEFSAAALGIKGEGWAGLAYCRETDRLLVVQIEGNSHNVIPGLNFILVLDIFEHAYRVDYAGSREKYVKAFWNFVNWENVNSRLKDATLLCGANCGVRNLLAG
jgi:superoxide dismutase, Fe-Mn family